MRRRNTVKKESSLRKTEICDDALEQVIGGRFHPNTEIWLKKYKTYLTNQWTFSTQEEYDTFYNFYDTLVEALIKDMRDSEEIYVLDEVKECLHTSYSGITD